MKSNSNRPKKSSKPASTPKSTPKKPRPDFPLSIHKGVGYWCKKIRGQVHYFGKVADDPKGVAAEEEWNRVKDDLYAGREPKPQGQEGDLTVADLCNFFLEHKEQLRDNGELNPRSYRLYYECCDRVCKTFGKSRAVIHLTPDDFRKLRGKLAEKRGPVALRNEMQRVRSLFKFGFDDGLLDAPVRFGQGFKKPTLETIRREREAHRAEHGDRMFEAEDIRKILAYVNGEEIVVGTDNKTGEPIKVKGKKNLALRAMILLAVNGALGQSDLAEIPSRAVDLESGWLDFARVKTAIARKIPLWPETIEAVQEWIPQRKKAADKADAGLLFLTVRGSRWIKVNDKGAQKDAIAQEFNKALQALGLKRPKVSFYALRRSFRTVADEVGDVPAIDQIMGHTDNSMASHYRERIGEARLQKVVEHVRQWLFPPEEITPPESGTDEPQGDDVGTTDPEDDEPITLRLFAG